MRNDICQITPDNFSVCIQCITYNHAAYIAKAMDGFIMQETNFDYVAIIVDDASTDGTDKVILGYLHDYFNLSEDGVFWQEEDDYAKYYFSRSKENMHCFFSVQLLKKNQYRKPIKKEKILPWIEKSQFIAQCEGDDYWIDPLKLQKQVDYLSSHSECSLCFANALEHWEDVDKPDKLFSNIEDRDYDPDETSLGWIVPTATSMFRKEVYDLPLYKRYISDKKIITGDLPLWLTLSTIGSLRGFSDVFSVYRRLGSGFMLKMRSKDRIAMGDHRVEIFKVFGNHYKKSTISMAMTHYRLAVSYAKSEKDRKMLLKSLWKFCWVRLRYPDVFLYHIRMIIKEKRANRQ